MTPTMAVVGFGNMGSALATGAVRHQAADPRQMIVIEADAAARERAALLGCRVSANAHDARGAACVVLAVKPQVMREVSEAIGELTSPALLISIMGGITLASIAEAFGPMARCVRAMPNLCVQAGEGMTAYACGPRCREDDRDFVTRFFGAVGDAVEVQENMLDAATAVSGSGPAYVFLLAEAWIDAAMSLGFDRATASRMVRRTMLGAATMMAQGGSPADLRAMVTSPGGTTSAALAVLDARGFRSSLHDALRAARDRGRELSAHAAGVAK